MLSQPAIKFKKLKKGRWINTNIIVIDPTSLRTIASEAFQKKNLVV